MNIDTAIREILKTDNTFENEYQVGCEFNVYKCYIEEITERKLNEKIKFLKSYVKEYKDIEDCKCLEKQLSFFNKVKELTK